MLWPGSEFSIFLSTRSDIAMAVDDRRLWETEAVDTAFSKLVSGLDRNSWSQAVDAPSAWGVRRISKDSIVLDRLSRAAKGAVRVGPPVPFSCLPADLLEAIV